jgi:predicted DNA-binding transcriptional regulator YafY
MTADTVHELFDLRHAFRLSERSGALLQMLLASRTVKTTEIAERFNQPPKQANYAVFRLRARLETYGVTVDMMHGEGYYLTPAMKAHVQALLDEVTKRSEAA